jgi:hypothetical protein
MTTSRVVIVGGPRCGKTTLAARYHGVRIWHTDNYVKRTFEESVEAILPLLEEPGPWVLEGVTTVRVLRAWLRAGHRGKPCDEIRCCWNAMVPLGRSQEIMWKGCLTVWTQIEPELLSRGVHIEY